MHGSDVTASLARQVHHLSPQEAADVLSAAWDRASRRRTFWRSGLALLLLSAALLAFEVLR